LSMNNFAQLINQNLFLLYATIGGILASVCCGIIGSFVVVRKIEYIPGGIAHSVLAGLGIAYFFNHSPVIGALIVALIAALIIAYVSLKAKKYENTIISALWSIGMAIGVIFMTKAQGYNADLMSYLFGNILMLSPQNLYFLGLLDLIILGVTAVCYEQFLATIFDPEFAKLRGLAVNFYYTLLLCLIAITVVILMQIVGIILLLALLILPAAIARRFTSSILKIILIAVVLGAIFTISGLTIAYQFNLPAGATIILLAGTLFFASLLFKTNL
jgi:zinc transport system permease protein